MSNVEKIEVNSDFHDFRLQNLKTKKKIMSILIYAESAEGKFKKALNWLIKKKQNHLNH
jgi:hypothetical protein